MILAYDSNSPKAQQVFDEQSYIQGAINTYHREFGNYPSSLKELDKVEKGFTKTLEYQWEYICKGGNPKIALKDSQKSQNMEFDGFASFSYNTYDCYYYDTYRGRDAYSKPHSYIKAPKLSVNSEKITDMELVEYDDKMWWIYGNFNTGRDIALETNIEPTYGYFVKDYSWDNKQDNPCVYVIPSLHAGPKKIDLELYIIINNAVFDSLNDSKLFSCEKTNNPNVKDKNIIDYNISKNDFRKIISQDLVMDFGDATEGAQIGILTKYVHGPGWAQKVNPEWKNKTFNESVFISKKTLQFKLDNESRFYKPYTKLKIGNEEIIFEGFESTQKLWDVIRQHGRYSNK